jgi:hypothetical protein
VRLQTGAERRSTTVSPHKLGGDPGKGRMFGRSASARAPAGTAKVVPTTRIPAGAASAVTARTPRCLAGMARARPGSILARRAADHPAWT